MQTILTYIIIALAVAYAVWKFIRHVRGKGDVCGCSDNKGDGKCTEGCPQCSSCPLCDHCTMKN